MTDASLRGSGPAARSLREGLLLSVLTLSVGGFTIVGASVNAPLIRVGLHLSEVGVGAIASAVYLGAMSTARLGGRLTDRIGPGHVIVGGMLTMVLGSALSAVAPSAALLYIGVAVAGLGYGLANPATTVLANPRSARRRGLVMSVKQSGVPLGGVVAGVILPMIGSAVGWRWAFLASVAACLALGLLVQLLGSYRPSNAEALDATSPASIRLRLPVAYGYGFLMAGVQVSIFAFTAVFLVESRHWTANGAGLGVSLLLLGGLIGRPLWGWLSDLFPLQRLRFLQGAAITGSITLLALALVPDPALGIALVAVGLCSVGWNGVYVAAVAEASDPASIGATSGASLLWINMGAVAFPIVIGILVQQSGNWAYGWFACAIVSALAFAVIMVSKQKEDVTADGHGVLDAVAKDA